MIKINWSWFTGALGYKDACTQCAKPLRVSQDGVLTWCDDQKYHLDCLLNKLASEWKPESVSIADWVGWGGVYPP